MARSISSPAVGLGETVGTGDMLGEVDEGKASAALGLGVTVGGWPSAPVVSAIEQIQMIGSVFIVPLTVRCSHHSIWIQKFGGFAFWLQSSAGSLRFCVGHQRK